jgi:hypothetical protein
MGAMEANFQSFLHRNHHLCLKIQLKGVVPRLACFMVNPPLNIEKNIFTTVLFCINNVYLFKILNKQTSIIISVIPEEGI